MIKNLRLGSLVLLMGICTSSFFACKADKKTKEAKDKEGTSMQTKPLTNKEQLYGTWKASEIDTIFWGQGEYTKDKEEEILKALNKDIKSNGMIYSFFSDGKASLVIDKSYQGATWKFEEKRVLFNTLIEGLNSADKNTFDDFEFYKKSGIQHFKAKINDALVLHFRQQGKPLANLNDDPYYPTNNQWRVTARKSETYKQMRQRLYNFTQHCHLLFKSAVEREQKKVYTGNTASIYKYYDGAIAIVDGGKVPAKWMANYYSPEEAMDAWGMANEYFKNKVFRGKDEGSYVIANEATFRKLLAKMEADL